MKVPGAVEDPGSIVTGDITYPAGDLAVPAYLARPAGSGSDPALLVLHEAFGLNDHIRDLARRFAAAGFVALAPDLYHRVGAPTPDDMQSIMTTMFSVHDADVVGDLDAAADHLRGLEGVDGRVGCVGFCSGGRQTLLFACSSAAIDAAIDCWGGFIDRAGVDGATSDARPDPVIDRIEGLRCPVLAVGGVEDANPSPELLHALANRAEAGGKDLTVKIYDGAGHAFLADYRDSYRPEPAAALWAQILEFFGQHLR